MLRPLLRCPICGSPMSFDPRSQVDDCPSGHRASTDPDEWHSAHTRMLIRDIQAFLNPANRPVDHPHHWITIERTRCETLRECASCAAWQLGPPWACDEDPPAESTHEHGASGHG